MDVSDKGSQQRYCSQLLTPMHYSFCSLNAWLGLQTKTVRYATHLNHTVHLGSWSRGAQMTKLFHRDTASASQLQSCMVRAIIGNFRHQAHASCNPERMAGSVSLRWELGFKSTPDFMLVA